MGIGVYRYTGIVLQIIVSMPSMLFWAFYGVLMDSKPYKTLLFKCLYGVL